MEDKNLKKKQLVTILSAMIAAICTFGLTACDFVGGGNTDSVDNDKHTHNYSEKVIQPTCTEQGYTIYTCNCGDTYKGNYVPARHTIVVTDTAVAATCIAYGWAEGSHCSVCNKVFSEKQRIPLIEHNYQNGVCTLCHNHIPTEGLTYKKITGGYAVSGIGTATDTEIYIASTYDGEPVISIGVFAFKDCSIISKAIIPNGITSIDYGAFDNCRNLKNIIIPDSITEISSSGYVDNGVYVYGNSLFVNCDKLNYNIYGNAKYLGNEANPYLVLLESSNKNITSCTINKDTKVIADYAFEYCYNLTSITIPDGITAIGRSAFSGCSSLTGVNISNLSNWCGISFGSLGNPLYKAHNLYIDNQLVSKLVIPDGVKSISSCAFEYCSSITSVTIPDSVTSIGSSAFSNCNNLTSVYYEGDIASWCGISGLGNLISTNRTLFINNKNLNKLSGTLIIPNGVTSIGSSAFRVCTNITSVIIPYSVTSIGNSAFSGCSNLTSVTIPDSVTSIGNFAFLGCSNLTSVIIPDSVTSIGSSAFNGCTGLTSVTISNSVTSIGNSAFYGCSNLTSVTIPDSVTSIGNDAFYGCSNLTSTIISNNMNFISDYAFCCCSSLTRITIPDSVIEIDLGAFYCCSGLNSIIIPDSVKSIGSWAFIGCDNLTDVYYAGSEEDWVAINIGINNESLTNAKIHYNYNG